MMNVDRDSTQNSWQSQSTLQRWKLGRLLMVVALAACAGFLPLGCQTPEEELIGDVGSLDDMAAREQEPREDDSDLLDADDELEPLVSVNAPSDETSEDESELSGGTTPETDQSADNFLRQVREEAAAHDRELRAERARLLKELLDADAPEVSTGDRSDDPVEALRTRRGQSLPDASSAEDALDLDAIQKQLSRAAERVEGGDTSQPKTASAPAEDGAATLRSAEDTVASEVTARPAAAKPLPLSQPNVKPQTTPNPKKKITRAGSYSDIFRLHHKTGKEFMSFVGENFPEWIEAGYIVRIAGRTRSLLIFGKSADDPITRKVHDMAAKFDDLEIRPISEYIRPRYVDTEIAMDALVMRGLAHLWVMTDETKTTSWSEGKKTVSTTVERSVYAPQEIAAGVDAPLENKPKIPYVYEIPSIDSFDMPENMQSLPNDALLVNFDRMSSTERRGGFMAVGTERD
ncbi:MAG: hypothetical protein MK538_18495, partial [Planctomycetes bacterium]|nr:hypothetical protein [Planctomycetota bacterium]